MKSSFYIPLALSICLCLFFTSCQKENNTDIDTLNVSFSVRYIAKGKAAKMEAKYIQSRSEIH